MADIYLLQIKDTGANIEAGAIDAGQIGLGTDTLSLYMRVGADVMRYRPTERNGSALPYTVGQLIAQSVNASVSVSTVALTVSGTATVGNLTVTGTAGINNLAVDAITALTAGANLTLSGNGAGGVVVDDPLSVTGILSVDTIDDLSGTGLSITADTTITKVITNTIENATGATGTLGINLNSTGAVTVPNLIIQRPDQPATGGRLTGAESFWLINLCPWNSTLGTPNFDVNEGFAYNSITRAWHVRADVGLITSDATSKIECRGSGGFIGNKVTAYTTGANLVLAGNGAGFVQVNNPLQVVGNATLNENLFMTGGKFFYLAGNETTDGSIRLSASGTNIITERKISGTWTVGTTIPA
jgi:hypothetical protein